MSGLCACCWDSYEDTTDDDGSGGEDDDDDGGGRKAVRKVRRRLGRHFSHGSAWDDSDGGRGDPEAGRSHHRRAVAGGGSPDLMPAHEVGDEDDRASSTSSDKYERDVAVLNRCFDDIERFIARLQHAAAAFQELERRRKSRKSKKKDHGDGMLSMRAKAPSEREFADILQKFKLSFNLLAKLKTHIHDPNAPELVHFLFTPLALIVDAARDSHPASNLPPKVVSPLLTRDALDLLLNCLTSKETELWHSLGPAWLHYREQWNGYVAPYQPVFLDGWSPDFPVMSEDRDRVGVLGAAVASEAKRTRGDEIRAAQHEAELREKHYQRERDEFFDLDHQDSSPEARRYAYDNRNYASRHEVRRERFARDERERSHTPVSEQHGQHHPHTRDSRSDISADSIEHFGDGLPLQQPSSHQQPGHSQQMSPQQRAFERAQRQWLEELKVSGAKVVQVTYPRTANNDKELTVTRGEYLQVLDDSRKWWKARNQRGQVAHVPHTIVSPLYSPDHEALLAYPPRDRFSQGVEREMDGSELGGGGGGARPPRSPIPPPASAEWIRKERQGRKAGKALPVKEDNEDDTGEDCSDEVDEDGLPTSTNGQQQTVPPPLPPPLPPPSPPSTPSTTRGEAGSNSATRKSTSSGPSREGADHLQQELKFVLTMFREKNRPPPLDITRTPEVYISQKSSAVEVQEWLRVKGFSTRICSQLRSMNGEEIFALSRQQLVHYCGKEEGHRLDSQLTVQRNVSGYKTARTSELRAILARARQKAEGISTSSPPSVYESQLSRSTSFSDDTSEDSHSNSSNGGLGELLRQQRQKIYSQRSVE